MLSTQEKSALITVAGSWALNTIENAEGQELIKLMKDADGSSRNSDLLMASFKEHYENLILYFED